ncbi:MAG: Membrane protein insertase YidC [Verrucomicrobiales bacterium]|nr:Membrane protein insertase YidC [Verrucomicrobiales bacterium]
MDRKTISILAVSILVIALWQPLVNRILPPKIVLRTNTVATATSPSGGTNGSATSTSVTDVPASAHAAPFNADIPEQTLSLTNEDAIYTFTSHGGGLKLVQLRHYPAATLCGAEKNVSTNFFATLNADATTAAMTLLGGETLQGDGAFQLTQIDNGVRVEKSLTNGLTIVKEFVLGTNYLISAKTRIENRSQGNILLPPQEWVVGTATPMSTRDKPDSVGFYFYNGDKAKEMQVGWFRSAGMMGCGSPTYKDLYEENQKIVWADVHNQFFTLATIPKDPADKIVSRPIDLPNARDIIASGGGGVTNGLQTSIIYPHTNLLAGQVIEKQFTIYAGPKEYNTLAKIAADMKNELDKLMGFGWAGFVAKLLLLSMNGLHALFGGALSYGWIIILITVLIKLLFWPLTNASTKSMKRMQAFQPQIKELQAKYKDDPTKLSRKQMEFFKEHKINPMGGCLPMLVQIPVFIGFYTMIRSAIELRGVHFLWACDLSQADTVGHIGNFPINILPIIYGITLLYQARIAPVSPTVDPAQQQMMKYMPLMFLFILYNMSAGLTLYWTVQNSLTILQMKLTKATDDTGPGGKTQVQIIPPKKKR